MFDARLFQVHLCSPRSPSFSISPYECIEGDPHSLLVRISLCSRAIQG
jgi:hypothetical protein